MLLHGLHGDEMEAERMLLAQARQRRPACTHASPLASPRLIRWSQSESNSVRG